MNSKIRTVVFALLTVVWCVLIFGFSSENGEESGKTSEKIVIKVYEVTMPEFHELPQEEQRSLIEELQFYVRKAAHFSLYFILGSLAWQSFCLFRGKFPRGALAVAFSFLYACADEFHQSLVPDRGPSWRDVLIDTGGALTGVLFSTLAAVVIMHIINKKRRSR